MNHVFVPKIAGSSDGLLGLDISNELDSNAVQIHLNSSTFLTAIGNFRQSYKSAILHIKKMKTSIVAENKL